MFLEGGGFFITVREGDTIRELEGGRNGDSFYLSQK